MPSALTTMHHVSGTAVAMCAAGLALLAIGGWTARRDIAGARGLDRILAAGHLCYAAPLAVFGALHLAGPGFVSGMVPPYMPWRSFWVPGVGFALLAASLSIATRIGVRWSGFLVGLMMFLFVAMLYLPGSLRHPDNRFAWTVVCRELSFGGAGWILAATAAEGRRGRGTLLAVGRAAITLALIVFGIEHLLHPLGLPGVPLQRQMPAWVPGRAGLGVATGAALLAAAASVLLSRKARAVTTALGGWLLLLLLAIYLPVLAGALADPGTPAQVEGINYFADTLLFAGTVLALARAMPRGD
jgi:uncharacterized membrane protein